ncbi:hypothetical protein ASE99_11040 [Serratia sp. Leaf51]|nr:hypothetical protein ASE99_11040 [Serratia sp. Leaf51]
MPLYKFLPSKYMDSFFETGCLQLGTIHDFKDVVRHIASRGDVREGQHIVKRVIDKQLIITENSNEPIASEIYIAKSGGKIIVGAGTKLTLKRSTPDSFIFCTSNKFSEELFLRWNEEDREKDSCYVIHNPTAFASSISRAINKYATIIYDTPIIYTDDPIAYDSFAAKLDPRITKNKSKFLWHSEHRTIWEPILAPYVKLRPWIVYVPEARQYCRRHSFLKDAEVNYY